MKNINMEELWTNHKTQLQSIAWRWMATHGIPAGYTAEDLVQEGYIALDRAAQTYDPDKYPGVEIGAWINMTYKWHLDGLLRNSSTDLLTTATSLDAPLESESTGTLHDIVASDVDVDSQAVYDLMMSGYAEVIKHLIERMDEPTRTVLYMHYLEGMALKDIKIPHAATLRAKGIRLLRQKLRDEFGLDE